MNQFPHQVRNNALAATNGDLDALNALFEWCRPMLKVHALRICGNTPLVQDALQDTHLAAILHFKTLRNPDTFYCWLKKVLVNNCYQLLRGERFTTIDDHAEFGDALSHSAVDAHFEKLSSDQRLYAALHRLSDDSKACILLRYFTGFNSYDEIALLLGIPLGTVRSRLAAARQKLGQLIKTCEDPGEASLQVSKEWSEYYRSLWSNVYEDAAIRDELFNHMHPQLGIRFTSGRTGRGRSIVEKEINDDLQIGTRFNAGEIVSSGNISIIEGNNTNTVDHPDRCAPSTVLVLFREDGRVNSFHIFDSPRPSQK